MYVVTNCTKEWQLGLKKDVTVSDFVIAVLGLAW